MTLGTIVRDAVAIRDRLKAGGMIGAELDAGLELVLREAWPKPEGRADPWRYRCKACRDYGLEMGWCPGDATCGSHPVTGSPRKPHAPHEYGRACWCPAGARHREKQTPTLDDAVTQAAKQRKPSRWGR